MHTFLEPYELFHKEKFRVRIFIIGYHYDIRVGRQMLRFLERK